jgi:hypothetical protein
MATLKQQDEFTAFLESCIWLQNCFNTFNHLYNSGKETEETLRRVAPLFFEDLNSILQEYFFLQIRKITDPANTRGRDNLTIQNINEDLVRSGLMSQEILDLSARILAYRDILSDMSNRVIAHADKETAFRPDYVGTHSESDLNSFMSDMHSYTDAVGIVLGVGPLDYRVQAGPGDVLDLIRALKRV